MKAQQTIEKIPIEIALDSKDRYQLIILDSIDNSMIFDELLELNYSSGYRVGYISLFNNIEKSLSDLINLTSAKIIVLDKSGKIPHVILKDSKFSSIALISAGSGKDEKKNILSSILKNKNLSRFSHLAYQTYRYNRETLRKVKSHFFEELRLGKFREEFTDSEPMLREIQLHLFDLNAIRHSDFRASNDQLPNGLYSEEACQLGGYIGMSEQMRCVVLYGISDKIAGDVTSQKLIAEILWHVAEASVSSLRESPERADIDSGLIKKYVSISGDDNDLCFVTSSITNRWWVEIPNIQTNSNEFVPCSESDYLSAARGEIPHRWVFYFQKINSY